MPKNNDDEPVITRLTMLRDFVLVLITAGIGTLLVAAFSTPR